MDKKIEDILIVDDKPNNLDGAKRIRDDYKVTTVESYVQALEAIFGQGEVPDFSDKIYFNSDLLELKPDHTSPDIVLSDLNFPLANYSDHNRFGGFPCDGRYNTSTEEKPLGYELIFEASKANISNLAILTDMNHHSGPLAACFDLRSKDDVYTVGNTEVQFFDERDVPELFYNSQSEEFVNKRDLEFGSDLSKKVTKGKEGWHKTKNWSYLLDKILTNYKSE